ncbi:MAG TPA: tail fiber protein [Pseudolabrys sp.]|jgi:microcystin-dependent protein
MANPFVGEIRCFGFNFAPAGWAMCNGQLMSISQNTALFSILGTTYGGDGQSTFGLPNLQGQIPMHWGNGPGGFNTTIGQVQGAATVTLLSTQMPVHNHGVASELIGAGGIGEHAAAPTNNTFIGPSAPDQIYSTSPTINASFLNSAIGSTGGSIPHDNMQPFLVLNFCIALLGIFPTRN